METVIAASLKVDASGGIQPVKSFRQELKEAQNDLLGVTDKFGATSKEAANAAKRVAELRDRMGDAKTLVDAFNPDAKFKGFGNVIQAVAGGFSALTGTMALFGVEGENVEKALLKVQAAMAISQGINSILEGADAFKAFAAQIKSTTAVQKVYAASTAITAAVTKALGVSTLTTSTGFKVLRGAIIATGIGALAVGLTLLINNFDSVKKYILNLIPGLSGVADFMGKIVNRITDFVGATSEAGRQLSKTIKGLESSISDNEKFLDLNADKYDQYTLRKIQADIDYKKKKIEFLKDDKLTEDKKSDLIRQAEEQRVRLIQSASEDRAKAQKKINDDALKLSSDQAKRESEEAKRKREERINELKQQLEDAKKLREEMQKGIEDATVKINEIDAEEKQREKDSFKERISNAQQNIQNEIGVVNELRYLQMDSIQQQQSEELYNLGLWYAERKKYVTEGSAAEIALTEEAEQRKQAIERQSAMQRLQVISGYLAAGADLLGKQTAAGKVLAIASATINTYVAASEALKANYGIFGPFAQIARIAAVATTIGIGLKNVKEIIKVKTPGSAGGSSMPSLGDSTQAPLSPQMQIQQTTTRLDQQSINQMGSAAAPIQTFVIDSDIKNNRERITRLNRAARLGG